MGANCCVAAKKKPLPNGISREISSYRIVRHRWDNRTHIEDLVENASRLSSLNNGNAGSGSKSAAGTETEGLSDGGIRSGNLQNANQRKEVRIVEIGIAGTSNSAASDQSTRNNVSAKEKGVLKSSDVAEASNTEPLVSFPTSPSSSSFKATVHSPSRSCFSLEPSTPRTPQSPQVSDIIVRSPNSPDGRRSFVLSVCSNDSSAGGSHGGSSGSWSMRTFTDLVAISSSSQREQLSLDGHIGVVNYTPFANLQTCSVCSKLLKEQSPWSDEKIVTTNELPVAAVLICGHSYHAECLENITSQTDQYDPPCPVCTNCETLTPKLLARAELKAKNRIFRRTVAGFDGGSASSNVSNVKWSVKSPSMGASSSTSTSLAKPPFLWRHFSIGARPSWLPPASGGESRKKKGFWLKR